MLIALDSNILIAALSPHEEHSTRAQQLIKDIASNRYQAVVSSIAYGEILSFSTQQVARALDLGSFLRQIKNCATIAADDTICLAAGELRRTYGGKLKLPDALHLATALNQKADLFITNDFKLAKVAESIVATKTLGEWV